MFRCALFNPVPVALQSPTFSKGTNHVTLTRDPVDLRTFMYTDDMQIADNNVVPEDYYNIRPLEFELLSFEPPSYKHAKTTRSTTEHILMGLGTLALIVLLYDGITGAGIISL